MGFPQNNPRKAPIDNVPKGQREGGMIRHAGENASDKRVNTKSNDVTPNLSSLNRK